MPRAKLRLIPVRDRVVRVLHWSLVAAYALAWWTGDGDSDIHEAAGYVVGALIAVRVIWGFIGPTRARFSDFVFRPATVIAYLRDLVMFRAKRQLGHSPAGGAMVVALLAILALAVATGLLPEQGGESLVGEVHVVLANLSLVLVIAHIGGVALASLVHRENLTRAMVTGRKRPES
jgi:cytochrome b